MTEPDYCQPRRLTREELEAAIAILRSPRNRQCQHVVHPHAQGWTNCATCFAPVFISQESDED